MKFTFCLRNFYFETNKDIQNKIFTLKKIIKGKLFLDKNN